MIGYLTTDLLFMSRVAGAANQLSVPLTVAPNVSSLRDKTGPDARLQCILIDLTLPSLDVQSTVEELRAWAPHASIIAYGPHVAEQALSRAQEAKCDLVLTRGQFDRSFQKILQTIRDGESLDTH